MSERLRRYMDEIDNKARHWNRNVGRPYVRAYDAAFSSYNNAWNEQKEDDKTKAELFVLAASIATGSVMMAVLATSSLRVVAGRVLLDTICKYNLNRTFEVLHFTATNKAAMFAIGKVLDESRSRIGKEIQQAALKAMTSGSIVPSASAINYFTRISDFVDTNAICAHETAVAIRDSDLSTVEKDRLVEQLEQASFYNPPPLGCINEQTLANRMELSFFMSDILNSDYLVERVTETLSNPMLAAKVGAVPVSTRRTPIEAMPRDRQNYPHQYRSQANHPREGQNTSHSVEINGPGRKVRDRIDTLHKNLHGNRPFFRDQAFYDLTAATRHVELQQAQRILEETGDIMRPRNPLATAFH